uniref:Uncharacterized protein n=1 Tax=viral metagenome TaxID=1070528 RepID=A0A6M3XYQ6_9ZZZZ
MPGGLVYPRKGDTMTTDEKDRLIEIMRQNIAEKELYLYALIRENIKLKSQRPAGGQVERRGEGRGD